MKILFLLLLLTSCNVLKTLTGGETKVPDEFFQNFDSPRNTLTFMGCNATSVCYFDTSSDSLVEFVTSVVQPTTPKFAVTNSLIYYTESSDNLAFYNTFNGSNSSTATLINAGSDLKAFNGNVYFYNTSNLYKHDGSSSVTLSTGASTVRYGAKYEGTSTGLYSCLSDTLSLSSIDTNLTTVTAIDPATDSAANTYSNIPCNISEQVQFYGDKYVSADGTNVYIYDFPASHLEIIDASSFSSLNLMNVSHSGRAYFWRGAGPYDLYTLDLNNTSGGFTLLHGNLHWQFSPVIDNGEGQVYFIIRDASNVDQMVEYNFSDGAINQLTNFSTNAPTAIEHVSVGSSGFYFFRSDGVWKLDFGTETVSQINSTTVNTSSDFLTIQKDQVSF